MIRQFIPPLYAPKMNKRLTPNGALSNYPWAGFVGGNAKTPASPSPIDHAMVGVTGNREAHRRRASLPIRKHDD